MRAACRRSSILDPAVVFDLQALPRFSLQADKAQQPIEAAKLNALVTPGDVRSELELGID
jgi:hypothetical protein